MNAYELDGRRLIPLEGYASSVAAAALKDLGLSHATDMIGGFHAWRAMGLPIAPRSNAFQDRSCS
jgi:3-mercaptopyruvate sulfurtransferase SseA